MPEVDFDVNVTDLYDAIGRSDWNSASVACRIDPVEAETWVVRRRGSVDEDDETASTILWRFLPLHSACARQPPSSFIYDLLKANPMAASVKDASGMYPLHYACGNRASKGVIKQLLDCFPQASKEADPQGMLPLHYIAQWGQSESGIVELLLDVYAEGVTALNGEGISPLDLCRDENYEEWEEVLSLMEGSRLEESSRRKDSLASPEIIRDKSTKSSSVLKRSPSPSESNREETDQYDARDEIATPRSRHTTSHESSTAPQSSSRQPTRMTFSHSSNHSSPSGIGTKLHTISCSLISPRYHEMKTPRSSGKGSFTFQQRTPRSCASAERTVEFDFDNIESTTRSKEGSKSHESNYSSYSSQSSHRVPPPSPSRAHHISSIRSESSKSRSLTSRGPPPSPGSNHLVGPPPPSPLSRANNFAEKEEMAYLQHENNELRSENNHLREQLSKLQDILSSRIETSKERRKMLLDILRMEEGGQVEKYN